MPSHRSCRWPAAIGNAMSAALGKPVSRIPIRPEDILALLSEDS